MSDECEHEFTATVVDDDGNYEVICLDCEQVIARGNLNEE